MYKTITGEIAYLSIEQSKSNDKVIVLPVFQTKEQEELFARCTEETMFKHMNDEVSFESTKHIDEYDNEFWYAREL